MYKVEIRAINHSDQPEQSKGNYILKEIYPLYTTLLWLLCKEFMIEMDATGYFFL